MSSLPFKCRAHSSVAHSHSSVAHDNAPGPTKYDTTVEAATGDYKYDDSTVELDVGGETFKIGRGRLTQRALVFRDMFGMPRPAPPTVNNGSGHGQGTKVHIDIAATDSVTTVPTSKVILHNDPADFRHFLWAVHADFLDAHEFMEQSDSTEKCMKLLGIASVAHMYESTPMANRSLSDALKMMEKAAFRIDGDLARKMVTTARLWMDEPSVLARAQKLLVAALREQRVDPYVVVQLAEPMSDRHLLGWGYYYLLKGGEARWSKDERLRPIDRRRLLAGAYALSNKWQSLCEQYSIEVSDARTPSWAIFDKISAVSTSLAHNLASARRSLNPSPGNAPKWPGTAEVEGQIERSLYSHFVPDPWGL